MSLLLALVTGGGGGGSVAYTLTGAAGSYSLTGRAGTFQVGHSLSGAAGSYALSGNAGSFKVGRNLSGSAGAYGLTGNAGTFSYTPGTPGATNYTLSGSAGAYVLAGNAASFKVDRALSGAVGSYLLSGNAAGFKVDRNLSGASGAYALAGNTASLTYTPGAVGSIAYSLSGEAGSYSLTGSEASFSWSGAVKGGGYDDDKPRKRRWFVEIDGRLLAFDSEQQALDALEASEPVIEEVKPSRRQRAVAKSKRAEKIAAISQVATESINLQAVKEYADLMGRLAEFAAAQQAAQYEQIRALHAQMIEEEEVEMLLLAC